jgi:hypothetical protein
MLEEKSLAIKRTGLVIAFYLLLAFFAIPHLIDDFLYGIPADFGISVRLAQFLGGVFIVIYLGILIFLVQGRKRGVIAAIGMGTLLALAGILKHIPLMILPGPYWSGWFSEGLIIGLIMSGLGVAGAGIAALRTAI